MSGERLLFLNPLPFQVQGHFNVCDDDEIVCFSVDVKHPEQLHHRIIIISSAARLASPQFQSQCQSVRFYTSY